MSVSNKILNSVSCCWPRAYNTIQVCKLSLLISSCNSAKPNSLHRICKLEHHLQASRTSSSTLLTKYYSNSSIMPAIPKLLLLNDISQPALIPQAYPPPPITRRPLSSAPCDSKKSEEQETRAIWRMCDAVCFDVDSTVCEDEAIDELAKFCGKEKEITQITKNAMSGKMDFRSALRTRLNIIKPTQQQLIAYKQNNPPRLTAGVAELVQALQQRHIPVYLVSGGFRSIIVDVAQKLNIPQENIYANRLKFYFDGSYAGFDEDAVVSRSGGKAEVVKMLKEQHDYTNIVMIGDGATDLHTCPPADAFIGFGGNQVRDEVKKNAKWFTLNFQELMDEMNSLPPSGKTK